MADIKISDMTVASIPLSGTEEFALVQSGSKKISVNQLDTHLSQTEKTLTNKTLGTATAVAIGLDEGGDTWYRDGLTGELVRVPIGTEGQVYSVDGAGAPVWVDLTATGLTYFVESESITTPNDTTTVSALTVVSAQTDGDAVIAAKGSGATLAQIPDNDITGGNKRGIFATDLQKSRGDPTYVASGDYSSIGGGDSNTASGKGSWVPGGINGNTRGITGSYAYSSTVSGYSVSGENQIIGVPLVLDTTDDTPTSMSSEYFVLDTTTTMVVPASSSMLVTAMVLARSDVGDNAAWIAQGLFSSDASGVLTRHGTASVTPVGTPSASLSTAAIDLIVNAITGSADVEVTGVSLTNIRWAGELKCVQILTAISGE